MIKQLDPFRCCMWALHDRLEAHVTEETCKAEIESFLKHGQLIPVLGRALRGDPMHDVELIFGARRLFVARHLNMPLSVELREVSDREAIIAMDIENRQRADVSPYERGMSYSRWLRSRHFESQEDIARALNISTAQISRLLKLAKLPSVIVGAFASAAHICETWGGELADLWEDPKNRHSIARQARAITATSPRPSAREVYQKLLLSSVHGFKPRRKATDEVVPDETGIPLFRIQRRARSIALVVPIEKVSTSCLAQLREAVTGVLQSSDPQRSKGNRKASDIQHCSA